MPYAYTPTSKGLKPLFPFLLSNKQANVLNVTDRCHYILIGTEIRLNRLFQ